MFLKGESPDKNRKSDRNNSALLFHELGENPYHKFNIAFSLMALLPSLATVYLLTSKLFYLDILKGDVGLILLVSITISLCGYWFGYKIIKNIFGRVVFYATKAKHSDEMKSSLVVSVSHEFKNPLSSLKLCLFDMTDGLTQHMNEEQKDMLDCCNKIVDRLSRLVNDLLDIYKIEAGISDINRKLCSLVELLELQIKEFEISLSQKNIHLETYIKDRNLSAWADCDKIARVFNNLLSNALKYTPEGGSIIIRIFETDGFVKIEFQDTGQGIPPEMIDKIFDKFGKIDLAKEGTGLGLALSKDIVELHNGRILAESWPGSGTKFTVILPKDLRLSQVV